MCLFHASKGCCCMLQDLHMCADLGIALATVVKWLKAIFSNLENRA